MFCGECGHQIAGNAGFCGECGSPVRSAPPAPPAPPGPPGPPGPPAPFWPAPVDAGPMRPRPRGRGVRVGAAVVAGVLVAGLAGWAAHLLPSTTTEVHAAGTIAPADIGDSGDSGDPAEDEGTPGAGDDAATTSLVTSCGQVLDVVPVEAVSRRTVVEVTMELHPVCPTGEWITSGRLQVRLTDADGAVLADGTFDLSGDPLLVPGFSDAASYFVARFGRGTAWVAPDSMASGIAAGSVLVECEDLEGGTTTPVDAGEVLDESRVTADTAATDMTRTPRETALQALRRQARADDPAVSELEGSWVPQLSSKKEGTFDDYDGHAYSLADIYQQFLDLRLKYPNVRLLNSSEWRSYTYGGYWVVIAGVPFIGPNQPNGWCDVRGIPPSQCFAKRLVRDGAPDGTTKHRR